jgi:NAD(P)-dependent dehydrogenase (short-subunit alcohol dehydrogenase family)
MKQAALITGGAKRLGRAIAIALAEQGYDILLYYCNSKEEAERTCEDIKKKGVRTFLLQADLQNPSHVKNLIAKAIDLHSGLSCLVNNASIFEKNSIQATDMNFYRLMMTIHVDVPFLLMKDFAKYAKKGLILNMLDTRIQGYETDYAAYTLSKKALKELTLMAANEWAPDIRVNGIAPGYILQSSFLDTNDDTKILQRIPMKKQGSLKDIQRSVEYFVQSDFVTGQVHYIDGGQNFCKFSKE